MIRKSLKFLIVSVLLLILLIFSALWYVVYTENGSRWAVNQAIDYWQLSLSYDQIEGSLAHGLTLENFSYEDESISLSAQHIHYQSQWSWFAKHVDINELQINQSVIDFKNNSKQDKSSAAVMNFKMPVTVSIAELTIVDTQISSDGTPQQQLDSIRLQAQLWHDSAQINQLTVKAPDQEILIDGELNFEDIIQYQLNTRWNHHKDDMQLNGKGTLAGDLNQVSINQQIELVSPDIKTNLSVRGNLQLLQSPQADLNIKMPETILSLRDQTITMSQTEIRLTGTINDYQVTLNSGLASSHLPASELQIKAAGNQHQITTEQAVLKTAEGTVMADVAVDWNDDLHITSRLLLDAFNPKLLLSDWPGIVSGSVNLEAIYQNKSWSIFSKNSELQGELKDYEFSLNASGSYSQSAIHADQVMLKLGENTMTVNGELTEQSVDLSTTIDWQNLSVIDAAYKGSVTGSVNFSGSYELPLVDAKLNLSSLKYLNNSAEFVSFETQGQWGSGLQTQIKALNVALNNNQFSTVTLNQSGWIPSHQVSLKVDAEEFTSNMSFVGEIIVDKNNQASEPQFSWQGQLLDHQIVLNTGDDITLRDPVGIHLGRFVEIEPACWQGEAEETLCIELNKIDTQAANNYIGHTSIDSFSSELFELWMPDNLKLAGDIQGKADFEFGQDVFNISADIQLLNGQITLFEAGQTSYQSTITKLQLKAQTQNNHVTFELQSSLADQSHLTIMSDIIKNTQNQWQLDADINGIFKNVGLLAGFTEEISDFTGELMVEGTASGLLNQLIIDLHVQQPEGYVKLSRLGTVIENASLKVKTDIKRNPVYHIVFSGNNIAEINQGTISSTGTFSQVSGLWTFEGDVRGENFMILNLPEMKFNISPELKIKTSSEVMEIKGEVVVNQGHLIVKQLPPSTVSNSPDLVVHTEGVENDISYPVLLNINTTIEDKIKLDVIGLNADLTGSMLLKQNMSQNLQGQGVLNLNNGSYEIYGQKLDISEGELSFNGNLNNPRIKVKASRTSVSGEVIAGVELGGTVNNLQSNLFSEPNLSDIEKLSYIMNGRGTQNSGNLDPEQLKQAAIVMGLNQSSPVFNQIQTQFGIDVLTIRESEFAADTVVEAGKKINDKLYVSYNQGLFNRLGFWVLKYRISQHLNLQTTQGDDQSVELVYTRKAKLPENDQDKD